jgi:hypothetical protein
MTDFVVPWKAYAALCPPQSFPPLPSNPIESDCDCEGDPAVTPFPLRLGEKEANSNCEFVDDFEEGVLGCE